MIPGREYLATLRRRQGRTTVGGRAGSSEEVVEGCTTRKKEQHCQ